MKGVASPSFPWKQATLEARHSIKCPIVILDGIAWGFTMMSGTIPSWVNGISSCLYVIPQVPFCPCLDANLSPIWGILIALILTFVKRQPSSSVVRITWSIIPYSEDLRGVETSLMSPTVYGCPNIVGLEVFPMIMSSPITFFPGWIKPSLSSFW